ncbi:sensor histidine kinase [Halapricum hydrolyticum]|uniref:histidine kinase n=1 Tax=Halapricum hydrolyticum TaxID=2979991 RepID=A0AAE3ID54_9EURY|nr:ATP-binding protein [Halapricum hydrolyticum]MCU4719404.1 ATP-binding protein [Halapricum hydrolyticum]MCU4728413.1 ATP-binding protein [Halapricum hydrolyticum]
MRGGLTLDEVVARAVSGQSDRAVRVVVGGAVTGVGVSLSAIMTARILNGFSSSLGLLFGGVFPLALAVVVAVAGLLIWRCRLTAEQSGHVGFWWAVGTVVATATGFALVLFEASSSVEAIYSTVIVAGNGASGGLGGLIVGWYDARRLRVATGRERERQRLADEREKLALVNRIVRHDIGNDLQIIAGAADVLERHVDPDGEDALERLQRTASEAIDLTERLRTFVTALEDEADLRPVAVQQIVRTQVDNLRERYPGATVSLEQPVPDAAVQADELLATVLHNLLSNAVTHNDSDDPHVIVTVEAGAETVGIRVEDDGPGIPEAERETLFERGELGPGSDGSGIGLYIVDMLVDRYGGSITVADSDAGGAAFEVELLRVESTARTAAASAQKEIADPPT